MSLLQSSDGRQANRPGQGWGLKEKEMIKNMTDEETKRYLLDWVKKKDKGIWEWPTDGCGYEQHNKFVIHRNKNWRGGDFDQFVVDYANGL